MPSIKITLTPKNFKISNDDKAKVVWLIKKYTSHAWLTRTKEALEAFCGKYEEYITKKGASDWRREVLQVLRSGVIYYEQGILNYERGKIKKGSDLIMDGLLFRKYLEDPRTEIQARHYEIGWRESPEKSMGIYKIVDVALKMAMKTELSFTGAHSFPDVLSDASLPEDISDLIDPLAPISTTIVPYEKEMPATGIWLPLSHPFGSPNYFEAGYSENEVEVPVLEELDWDTEDDLKKGLPPKNRHFSYQEVQGKFILLWEENRYQNGRIPDESVYLDPSTEIPDEALVLFPEKK